MTDIPVRAVVAVIALALAGGGAVAQPMATPQPVWSSPLPPVQAGAVTTAPSPAPAGQADGGAWTDGPILEASAVDKDPEYAAAAALNAGVAQADSAIAARNAAARARHEAEVAAYSAAAASAEAARLRYEQELDACRANAAAYRAAYPTAPAQPQC